MRLACRSVFYSISTSFQCFCSIGLYHQSSTKIQSNPKSFRLSGSFFIRFQPSLRPQKLPTIPKSRLFRLQNRTSVYPILRHTSSAIIREQFALVAQLDSASVFGTEGCRFESCRVYSSHPANFRLPAGSRIERFSFAMRRSLKSPMFWAFLIFWTMLTALSLFLPPDHSRRRGIELLRRSDERYLLRVKDLDDACKIHE